MLHLYKSHHILLVFTVTPDLFSIFSTFVLEFPSCSVILHDIFRKFDPQCNNDNFKMIKYIKY